MNSFEQRQPPTPTRTPTSPSLGDFFQTPKVESSFYDPRVNWNTADPNAPSPNGTKTPQALSFGTPTAKETSASSPKLQNGRTLGSEFAANAQHILSTPDFSSLQVDYSEHFSSTQNSGPPPESATPAQFGLSLNTSTSVRSAKNMQTPPPTTTSASKRQGQKAQENGGLSQQTPAQGARHISAPLFPRPDNNETSNQEIDESPVNFSALDCSPDVFGYNFNTPATAPAYPQHKLFWVPSQGDNENLELSDMPNPFDTPRQSGLDPFVSNHPSVSSPQAEPSTSFLGLSNDDTTVPSFVQSSFVSTAGKAKEIDASTKPFYSGVDPTLLFSSPSKQEPLDGLIANARVLDEESLQPYAYQLQEAKRDKAYSGVSKPKKRRKPSVDSPAVKAALESLRDDDDPRPPIRRSMTDSVVSRASRDSAGSKASSNHGRSSPLKRMSENRNNQRKSSHRTSIALTIDENGRARAETRVIRENSGPGDEDAMEVDSGSETSRNESSSDDQNEDLITSFSEQPPGPKAGRFNTSASHSQKSSYASFYSSNSYQDTQPTLPEIKHRPATSAAPGKSGHLFGLPPLKTLEESTSMEDHDVSEAETVMDTDDDNAQFELRKVMKSRQKGKAKPTHHLYSPNGLHTAVFPNTDQGISNISPTTVTDPDLSTPTSGRSNRSDLIRCLCNTSHDDGQMIQW